MDNRVSWNTQPERDNPTVVLLVGGVRTFTAHTHKVLEIWSVRSACPTPFPLYSDSILPVFP